MPKPHDALSKAILSVPEYIAAFLARWLPAAVVAEFAPDRPPQVVDKGFTAGLRQSQCDMVFRIDLEAGDTLFVPMEHKSQPDPGVLLQLLGYQQAIWARYAKTDGQGGLVLPLVIPMVVYNGERPWNIPGRLSQQMKSRAGATAEAARGMAEFSPVLADLRATPPDELTDHPELWALLAVSLGDPGPAGLGGYDRPALLSRIAHGLPLLREEPIYRRVAEEALHYVYYKWDGDAWTFLQQQIPLAKGEEGAKVMKTAHEHWLETEGPKLREHWRETEEPKLREHWLATEEPKLREQWLATEGPKLVAGGRTEGMAQGRTQGQAKTLLQILEHRFDGVSDEVRARITQAPVEQLEAWTLRIINVESPEDLFNGDAGPRH